MRDPLEPARAALAQGRFADSRRLCQERLARAPADTDALHLAAIAELQSGSPRAALALIDRAIELKPRDAAQHQTRGLALSALGSRSSAAEAFGEALRLDAKFPDAYAALGLILLQDGDPESARQQLTKAVALRAAPEWEYNLALAESRLGRPQAALEVLRRVLAARPDFAQAHALTGSLLLQSGDASGAEGEFRAALAAGSPGAGIYNDLGAALQAQGRLEAAEGALRAGLRLHPRLAHAWNNLGNVVRRLGRRDEAESCFREAVRTDPGFAPAWTNLGNVAREAERYDEAMACLRRGLALDPSSSAAHLSLAICHLALGQFDRGWDEYRWRSGEPIAARACDDFVRRIDAGERVAISGEQGLGDALFFLRWAQPLARSGARFTFRGDRRLFPILETTGVFSAFLAADRAAAVGAPDFAAGDLPWLAGSRVPATPAPLELRADAAASGSARALLASLGPPPHIGICWSAGIASGADAEHLFKRVPPDALGAALREARATVVSVQRAPPPRESNELQAALGRPVHDCSAFNEDLVRMLALLDALDEYVGVSSTNVHLRAGLGKGARVLVPAPPEWRYGTQGERSPWFPQFALYREEREAGWQAALDRLANDLRRAA